MAVCVAILARQNYPLYMRTIPSENTLKFHFIVHSSLDVIEDRMVAISRTASEASAKEAYLGFLLPIQDYNVYGYVTNCHVKFVILLESSNLSIKDHDMQAIFKKLHTAYSEAVSNPFYNNGETIKSPSFDKVVNSVMRASSQQLHSHNTSSADQVNALHMPPSASNTAAGNVHSNNQTQSQAAGAS